MKQKQDYEFAVKSNDKLGYKGIVLRDKTQLILTKHGLSIMLPKKKFSKILNKQMQDKNKTHIGITFDNQEIEAIVLGFKLSHNKWKKENERTRTRKNN